MARKLLKRHKLLFTRGKPKAAPEGIDQARWDQLHKNCQRAEAMTGVSPITAEGWEKVAVMLMDVIEKLEKRRL